MAREERVLVIGDLRKAYDSLQLLNRRVRHSARSLNAAAREIKTLITQSVDRVQTGTRVVDETGVPMSEVMINARQINQLLSEIAPAASEQATGVNEEGHSIQELERSTRQKAGLVQQTTSAAEALCQQADLLQNKIANFRVAQSGRQTTFPATPLLKTL